MSVVIADEPFWRRFWSGPPAAGLFALIGAGVAFEAARRSSRAIRRGAERQEWWLRAEWAMNLARSPERLDRLIGLNALEVLQDGATEMEEAIIAAVTHAVTGDDVVDNETRSGHNETYRRGACAWLKKDE